MSRGLGRIERAILASIASSKQMAINRTKKYRKVVKRPSQPAEFSGLASA
jgi:hypothetical protein